MFIPIRHYHLLVLIGVINQACIANSEYYPPPKLKIFANRDGTRYCEILHEHPKSPTITASMVSIRDYGDRNIQWKRQLEYSKSSYWVSFWGDLIICSPKGGGHPHTISIIGYLGELAFTYHAKDLVGTDWLERYETGSKYETQGGKIWDYLEQDLMGRELILRLPGEILVAINIHSGLIRRWDLSDKATSAQDILKTKPDSEQPTAHHFKSLSAAEKVAELKSVRPDHATTPAATEPRTVENTLPDRDAASIKDE